EAVDADDLALEVAHRADGRALLDVEARAETTRAFARHRGDDSGGHAFRGSEDHAVCAAGGKADGARLERLPALVRAGEPGGIEGIGLALVLGKVRPGHEQPDRLLRRRAVAEPQGGALREGGACACRHESRETCESAQCTLAVTTHDYSPS